MDICKTLCFCDMNQTCRRNESDSRCSNCIQRDRTFCCFCGKSFYLPVGIRHNVTVLRGEKQLSIIGIWKKNFYTGGGIYGFSSTVTYCCFKAVCSHFCIILAAGKSINIFFDCKGIICCLV